MQRILGRVILPCSFTLPICEIGRLVIFRNLIGLSKGMAVCEFRMIEDGTIWSDTPLSTIHIVKKEVVLPDRWSWVEIIACETWLEGDCTSLRKISNWVYYCMFRYKIGDTTCSEEPFDSQITATEAS